MTQIITNRTGKLIFKEHIKYARRIKDLGLNDVAYVVPWAYDPKTGNLNIDFPVGNEPAGTRQMKISKTGEDEITIISFGGYEF